MEIKANELRIGNIIYSPYTGKKERIKALIPKSAGFTLGGAKLDYSGYMVESATVMIDWEYELEPVELTKIWLFDFGLTEDIPDTKFIIDNFKIMVGPQAFALYWKGMFIRNINYVHQLQNLVQSLSDIELELANH